MKKIINKMLDSVQGNKKKQSNRQKRSNIGHILDHIKGIGFHPKTIIDVGIAYGTAGLYGKYDVVEYLLIEPLIEYEQVCKNIVDEFGGKYIIAAASDKCGDLTINVHPDLSGSSLFNESEGKYVDGEPRIVECITLDNACEKEGMSGPYLIKLDTQGAELLVLDGAKKIFDNTEVIIMEAFLFQFYKGIPLLYEIIVYMKEKGFVVYDIFGGINRLLDNALAQVDLVFVKEKGIFRDSSNFATKEQRQIFKEERMQHLR
ncbi:FkbM family methyltransferase [Gammaproteobacteria bacterium]|nr:FkbM family methyltransferase [Gammaproteobacteria bacterium]